MYERPDRYLHLKMGSFPLVKQICKAICIGLNTRVPTVVHMYQWEYSGPCDLRPLHLTIPSILRPAISDTSLVFSV